MFADFRPCNLQCAPICLQTASPTSTHPHYTGGILSELFPDPNPKRALATSNCDVLTSVLNRVITAPSLRQWRVSCITMGCIRRLLTAFGLKNCNDNGVALTRILEVRMIGLLILKCVRWSFNWGGNCWGRALCGWWKRMFCFLGKIEFIIEFYEGINLVFLIYVGL